MVQQPDYIVTTALDYANGDLHLGHMLEKIQADIYVRYLKMQGQKVVFLGGQDAHGTPIMLRAQALGIEPASMVQEWQARHRDDLAAFQIDYDQLVSTHDPKNQVLTESIYNKLHDDGHILERTVEQYYDTKAEMFLPDRYIKGTCPKCGLGDQYGDGCEGCGAKYDPEDLKSPYSVLNPDIELIKKKSKHAFFALSQCSDESRAALDTIQLQSEVKHKLVEWFDKGLLDWNISRDKPYFGFSIPGMDEKFFYVWVDAPVGYMTAYHLWAEGQPKGLNGEEGWVPDSKTTLEHFIGKDIVFFHGVFWPAMLKQSGYRLPSSIWAHGFLTVEGAKMSKSRGTFITARQYLEHLAPDYLRYYFATRLSTGVQDLDLAWDEFQLKINADLVGKYVNLASRSAGFIHKRFDSKLADALDDQSRFDQAVRQGDQIAEAYASKNYALAMKLIMALADDANAYINDLAPWALAKQEGQERKVHLVCTQALNIFKLLSIYLAPVLPETVAKAMSFLNCSEATWAMAKEPLLGHDIESFPRLMERVAFDPEIWAESTVD